MEFEGELRCPETPSVLLVRDGLVAVRVADHNAQQKLIVRQFERAVTSTRGNGELSLGGCEAQHRPNVVVVAGVERTFLDEHSAMVLLHFARGLDQLKLANI